jgi:hypothetical protein
MALTNLIKPDIAIDHHNYGNSNRQFYTVNYDANLVETIHRSAVDCAITFKKALPDYFGNAYGFPFESTGAGVGIVNNSASGKTSDWWYENGVPVALTVEISDCINYANGEHTSTVQDKHGYNTYAVGEYTLRNQLLRYCQHALRITHA